MKRKILKILVIVFFAGNISSAAFSLNLDSIVAYPVPFNPNSQTLKIDRPGVSFGAYSIKIEILDINGDGVLSRHYSNFASILWNGRNGSGKKVKPGLYIIKVIAEDPVSGDYGKKIIRILVDY